MAEKTRNILEEVARATDLREGPAGVRSILQHIARRDGVPLKELARSAGLPVPVVSAVRRELEKREILVREKGVSLSEAGRETLRELGITRLPDFVCGACRGRVVAIPASLKAALEKLEDAASRMPTVDVTLDQAYALPETSMRRVLLALDRGALAGRRIVFLGDDDLTSVACALALAGIEDSGGAGSITVVEIDARINEVISGAARDFNLDIEIIEHDLREPLPAGITGGFDTFFTDPPYTVDGLALFLDRASAALAPESGVQGFLSFAARDPGTDREVFRRIDRAGFVPAEVIPSFNRYTGAEIIGNESRMIRLTGVSERPAAGTEGVGGPIYSGQFTVTRRKYRCAGCGAVVDVGAGCNHETIEILKDKGCPECGEKKFRLRKRKKAHG